MKTNSKLKLALFIAVGVASCVWKVDGEEGAICTDVRRYLDPCQSGLKMKGGCTRLPVTQGVDTTNCSSESPDCRRLIGSYCEGLTGAAGTCGTECINAGYSTGSRNIGNEYNTVQVNATISDLWCVDYDETILGQVYHRVCSPLCYGGQETGGTVEITIVDCKLSSVGCEPSPYE